MRLDYYDMQFKHEKGCCSKDSKNIEMRNITREHGIGSVEYDAYCTECGCWLYSFSYGHYNMY